MLNEFRSGVPAAEYHADKHGPSLSASVATTLCNRSPAHAWLEHPRLGGARYRPTESMDLGTLVHALVLGAGTEIVMVGHDDWRTNAAKQARAAAQAEGKIAVLEKGLVAGKRAAARIKARLADMGIELTGESELCAYWTDSVGELAPVQCRGMMDHVVMLGRKGGEGKDGAVIYDLKCWESANPDKASRKLDDYGGDVQAAAYTRAVERIRPDLAGRVEYVWLVAEPEPPYVVTPIVPLGTMREVGDGRWRYALARWSKCLSAGTDERHWPGYVTGPVGVEAPPWVLEREMMREQP